MWPLLALSSLLLLGCLDGLGELRVARVEPSTLVRGTPSPIVIEGAGLEARLWFDLDTPSRSRRDGGFRVRLLGGPGRVDLENVRLDASLLKARVPSSVEAGEYRVEVEDPWGRRAEGELVVRIVHCTADSSCANPSCSQSACDLQSGVCVSPPLVARLRDDDQDGFGAGPLTDTCEVTGFVDAGGDCDDLAPLVFPGTAEICDQLDNDCDGSIDEGCAPSSWTDRTDTGGASHDWYTVATHKKKWVSIAGASGQVWTLEPGRSFEDASSRCSGTWRASWVNAKGVLFLGGEDGGRGALAQHDGRGCASGVTVTFTSSVRGVVGFDAILPRVLGVGAEGASFVWRPAAAELRPLETVDADLFDVHGDTPRRVFTVGASVETPRTARVFRLDPWERTWLDERVQELEPSPRGALRSVFVLGASFAIAVGEGGLSLLWDGTRWRRGPELGAATATGVVALSASLAYAVDESGTIWRYDGQRWSVAHVVQGRSLQDVAASRGDDVWAVGTDGAVAHWPD